MTDAIFNLHDVVLLMTAALALLVAVPMFYQRRYNNTNLLLAAFVLSQGAIAFYYLLLYAPVFREHTLALLAPYQIVPLLILYTMQGFLLFWYSNAMAGNRVRITSGDLWVVAGLWLAPIGILGFIWSKVGSISFDGVVLVMPALIVSIIYGFRAWATLVHHDRAIRERYSNIDDKTLMWLNYSAMGFVVIWALRLAGHQAGLWGSHYWAQTLSMWANPPAMILIAWMVILGLSQKQQAARPDDEGEDAAGQSKSFNEESVRRLEDLMTRVKVYQDPELNREGLADSLGVSPRSLSALINGHYGLTFYEFVNQYRVREATERLADTSNAGLTVQRIFEDAGFNSKSTFNTLFKKATGKTPSEFRRQRTASARA